ncbi:MAG: DHA2 family efflux MFS transporter permease subunit [Sphingomonadaceae bacterium]
MGEAALPVKNKALLTLAVMGASIIQILDSTIANVAIPHMQTSLGATQESINWVLTSYIIASAVAIPMTGWLADRVGARQLFIAAVIGFTVSSMLCGAATTIAQMVIYRVLQGICSAFIGPLSQTILLDINTPEAAPKAMAMWGMGIMVAPILGPIIGGWLTENYNWRWVFYINLPIGIPTIALLWWLMPKKAIVRRHFDLFGFSMLALALASLQLMLDRGTAADWFNSWEICIELGIAISAIWVFAIHQMTAKNPILNRALLSNGNFVTALAFMVIIGIMMFGIFALFPPMLQRLFGYSVLDTGILLAPRGIGILFSMFVVSRLTGKIDPRIIIGTGFLFVAYSFWEMTKWTLVMDWQPFVIIGVLQGIGMGCVFIPMNGIAFATLPGHLRTDGSSFLYLLRSLGGSMGISLLTTVLGANIQTAHQDIASHITATTFSSVDPASADRLGTMGAAALGVIDAEVNRQAAMIAYLDDFQLMMVVILCCLPLVLVLRPAKAAVPK